MKKESIILLIILLTIGFATVSTTLIINSNIGVKTNTNNFIDGLVFDEASLRKSNNDITAEVSESGRTLSFTTQTMTNVDETSTVYFKIKNYSQYNATLETPAINCYFVDSHNVDEKATSTGTTHEYMELIPGSELDGDTIKAGGKLSEESSVTVKQIKSSINDNQEVKFQCEINANASDSDTPAVEKPKSYELEDANNNGVADIGEVITIGTESFYVISNNGTKLNALAMYNLNIGSNPVPNETYGIQNKDARGWMNSSSGIEKYGNVKFSDNDDLEEKKDLDLKKYSGIVKDVLYGDNGYENYIKQIIPDTKLYIRLINKGEIDVLVNDGKALSDGSLKTQADDKEYSWLYYTTYWTQTSDSSGAVWGVFSDGGIYSYYSAINDYCYGVRPVITITLK